MCLFSFMRTCACFVVCLFVSLVGWLVVWLFACLLACWLVGLFDCLFVWGAAGASGCAWCAHVQCCLLARRCSLDWGF